MQVVIRISALLHDSPLSPPIPIRSFLIPSPRHWHWIGLSFGNPIRMRNFDLIPLQHFSLRFTSTTTRLIDNCTTCWPSLLSRQPLNKDSPLYRRRSRNHPLSMSANSNSYYNNNYRRQPVGKFPETVLRDHPDVNKKMSEVKVIRICPSVEDLESPSEYHCTEEECRKSGIKFRNMANLDMHLTRHHKFPSSQRLWVAPLWSWITRKIIIPGLIRHLIHIVQWPSYHM